MDQSAQYLYDSNMSDASSSEILTYNLFGESTDMPDVVHCESIQTRSTLHDWEFAPHRHARLHQILLIEDGQGTATIEGERFDLTSMTCANVPTGVVHGFSFQPGTRGLVVTLTIEMLDQSLRPGEGLRQLLTRPEVFTCNDDQLHLMRDLSLVFIGRDFARAQILRSLAGVLLGQVARALSGSGRPGQTPEPDVLLRFLALIDLHFAEHWTVARYAAELAISPTHLSRLARDATGRPASGLIEERLIREARRNLVYTNLPVSRIAYALGFDDPAYFSRVFSRATGQSPRAFRRKLAER